MTTQTSPEVADLFSALSVAQAEIGNVVANKAAHKHKYAELSQVLDEIKKPLAENGLAIIQLPFTDMEGGIARDGLKTILTHKSGQWIQTVIYSPPSGKTGMSPIQEMGSNITYMRRYSIAAMLGIAQEDDDGHRESPPNKQGRNSQTSNANPKKTPLSDSGVNQAIRAIVAGAATLDHVLSLHTLTSEQMAIIKEKTGYASENKVQPTS